MKARIPTLHAVFDPNELRKHLARVVPARWGKLRDIQIHSLQHHRTSRCTVDISLQTTTGNYELVGKVYAKDRSDVYRAMQQISESGFGPEEEFSIPQPFAYIPELNLLLQEKVQGPLVKEIFLTGSDQERAVAAERCARWLAQFHQRAKITAPVLMLGHELFEYWVDRLAKWAGPQAEELTGKAARLCERLENAAAKLTRHEMCACHGDYSHYQIILTDTRMVTADWDGLCIAHPGLDIARFIIVLQQLALESQGSLNAFDAAAEVFYKTYTAESGFDVSKHLPFYKAAHCLRSAKYHLKSANGEVEMAKTLLDEGLRTLGESREIQACTKRRVVSTARRSNMLFELSQTLTDSVTSALKAVLNPSELGQHLSRILPPHWGTLQDIRIQAPQQPPAKRRIVEVTLLTTTGRHELIGKVYRRDRSDVYRLMEEISQSGFGAEEENSIPHPFTYVRALSLLLQEKVKGPLAEEIFLQGNEQSSAKAAERCARWLAQFHALDSQVGKIFNRKEQLISLERRTQRMAAVGHPLADKASQLYKRLIAVSATLDGAPVCPSHGDYGHRKIILTAARTVTFDWDRYRLADPCRDVARFIIKLQELALATYGSFKALDTAVKVFYDTYTRTSQFEVANHLAFYKAALCLTLKSKSKPGRCAIEETEAMLDEGCRVLAEEI